MPTHSYQDFGYTADAHSHMHGRIAPAVLACASPLEPGQRVLDIGCGKGALLKEFAAQGCEVVGVDLSEQGITLARKDIPGGRFEVLGADANLRDVLGEAPFDLVISTEVVEHVYAPREWARACHHALKPGGRLICSTPYHGYLKNVLLSLLNKWDTHADPLWDGGHIKLWSRRTLTRLLTEIGFRVTGFHGVGRFPGLWMTMVVTAQKAANPPA